MQLTPEQQSMLSGEQGGAAQKALQILFALGEIYGAERMLPITSAQIAGVSFDNLGEAGLQFLSEMAETGGRVRVLTTLNPAGMDIENQQALGIDEGFAINQRRVIDAFARMGIITTCSCTPYLAGNVPHYGEHLAWSESSAVCYANSVLGARTNREGGPSALAAAIAGFTPEYGYHLDETRRPAITIQVQAPLQGTSDFGALGKAIGEHLEAAGVRAVPYILGVPQASLENLKSFSASLATYGGAALFHMPGVTPEAALHTPPADSLRITQADLQAAAHSLSDASPGEADFVSLGCPHLSIQEIARIAGLLEGRHVTKEFWITTSRPVKQIADRMGYTRTIEASGAKIAADTCCVVAPIKGRFKALITDSAKACYYAYAKNGFHTVFLPFDEVVEEALR
ncbi:MAG: aconitase X catalytic domain-containing protein [Anaerolineales bacterium]|nr:aconitase X catalytic domain-containing protein [Anaerolineales bacterium]